MVLVQSTGPLEPPLLLHEDNVGKFRRYSTSVATVGWHLSPTQFRSIEYAFFWATISVIAHE